MLFVALCAAFLSICHVCIAFEYSWQIDGTPQGQESATAIQPVQVVILDQQIDVEPHSASIELLKRYSVILSGNWTSAQAHALLQTFKSIPQLTNHLPANSRELPASVWSITSAHQHNDITIDYQGEVCIVTLTGDAFVYANPFLAKIEGVVGRYFSKRLHRVVLRYVTDHGRDRQAVSKILRDRYDVSNDVPNYAELTKHTTNETASRFTEFKSEELITLLSMFEEMPSGMIKIPGLKYIVRRLDGTPNPFYPTAPAVAWTGSGYIEFMDTAFTSDIDQIHRLILHEKAHFLWDYLFDDKLKEDWIALGGWYKNPNDPDGWSTTKQNEFVSAYAHGVNPNEDMAESISFYIVRPNMLRSRSPDKYDFIQNRIMHGTRYISRIREDLTFRVYNLYPDYVYPGRIVRVDISVSGEPEQDKQVTIIIALHKENEKDGAKYAYLRIYSDKGTDKSIYLYPTDTTGHVLKAHVTISRYAANGYWTTSQIQVSDEVGNQRFSGQVDFGWKLYIDNPLADDTPPQYVPHSMQLSKIVGQENGRAYQVVIARFKYIENNDLSSLYVSLNDSINETYTRNASHTNQWASWQNGTAQTGIIIPDYQPHGIYELNHLTIKDVAGNHEAIYFTDGKGYDEKPATIDIKTLNPDTMPPTLDYDRITIKAVPTRPDDPNGETNVDISFFVKDDISGYHLADLYLRDPSGQQHHFSQYPPTRALIYFQADPTVFMEYHKRIVLPVGSKAGIWGLSHMRVKDKANNTLHADFTEILRFEVTDTAITYDLNNDGIVNILDLVIIANDINKNDITHDLNNDGVMNILDLVIIANEI